MDVNGRELVYLTIASNCWQMSAQLNHLVFQRQLLEHHWGGGTQWAVDQGRAVCGMREVQPTPGVLFGPSLTLSNKQALIPGQITAPNKRIRARARQQLSERGDCVREESDGPKPGESWALDPVRESTAANCTACIQTRRGWDGMGWHGIKQLKRVTEVQRQPLELELDWNCGSWRWNWHGLELDSCCTGSWQAETSSAPHTTQARTRQSTQYPQARRKWARRDMYQYLNLAGAWPAPGPPAIDCSAIGVARSEEG
ncbi:hypothetical protein NEUTE2DRAFT_134802 [Neurospora tetrasperma FGSC 2509]|nr:hypothetical protein NEUTE2DRAFT_134802 [Neurospora tetrasperma FGSC 2509]